MVKTSNQMHDSLNRNLRIILMHILEFAGKWLEASA